MSLKRIIYLFLFITVSAISGILVLAYQVNKEFDLVEASQQKSHRS
jgi:hypothetical protein